MAKVLSDITTDTRNYLNEANPANWSAASVLSAINYGYHHVVSKVVEVYQEFYLTVTPLQYSTVANQQQYVISTSFLKLERVEINYQPSVPNSEAQRAVAIKMDEIPLGIDNSLLGGNPLFNAGYYLIGSQSAQAIGFVPVPQETATNNISVWGILAPSDLVNTTDPVLIPYPDLFAGIISKIAASRLLKQGQQAVTAADDLMNEANADLLNMQTFISERQSDGPNMISEAAYDDIDLGNYIY